MARRRRRLSDAGPLPRPNGLRKARDVMRREAFSAPGTQIIRLETAEFTSLCPRTGQPDFGRVVIEYVARKRCLESKAVKYYLWAYRSRRMYCEELAARIADDVVYAISPRSVRVEVHQNPRGGIAIVATAVR